jgi:Holliday junction resolvase RusA-like endonuclease
MTNVAEIEVPMLVPSVNHYVVHTRAGVHFKTKKAISFRDAVYFLSRGMVVQADEYAVSIALVLGKGVRLDIDNSAKLALDSLVYAGVIRSDAAVMDLRITKHRALESSTKIQVRPFLREVE